MQWKLLNQPVLNQASPNFHDISPTPVVNAGENENDHWRDCGQLLDIVETPPACRCIRVAVFTRHVCRGIGRQFHLRFHECPGKVEDGPSKTFRIKLFGGKAENGPYKMAFCFVKYFARPFKKGTFSLTGTANTPGPGAVSQMRALS